MSSTRKDARWMVATKMLAAVAPELDSINDLPYSSTAQLLDLAEHINQSTKSEAEIQALADEWNQPSEPVRSHFVPPEPDVEQIYPGEDWR